MNLVGKRVRRKPRCSNWENYWRDGKNYEWGTIVADDGYTLLIVPEELNTERYWRLPKNLLLKGTAFLCLDIFKGYKNKRRSHAYSKNKT